MNDAFILHFIVYCCTPNALYNHVCVCVRVCVCVCVGGGGGSLLNHHHCAVSTRQPQVERRESHSANQVDGDYWEAMVGIWPMGGIWPEHRGYTLTLYDECHGILNDHRESGPRFNVSSKRRLCTFVCGFLHYQLILSCGSKCIL